jgi:hypothetical protein
MPKLFYEIDPCMSFISLKFLTVNDFLISSSMEHSTFYKAS